MARKSNPLEAKGRSPQDLKRYFLAAAEFWMEAIRLQGKRCEAKHEGSRDFVADVIFYAVGVQHLREIARMASERVGAAKARAALDAFDQRWPNFKHLRDLIEHVLPPESNPNAGHFGVSFFPGSIVDLRPGGEVEHLIDVRDAALSIEALYRGLSEALQDGAA
ncbi:MAG TPA: hypothetical protein VH988_21705 [Thermoanaerobaculia bacterium]|nr:hypothetical protein [Thermoanaerobaculia bacterium]